jgi:hypothetical protein
MISTLPAALLALAALCVVVYVVAGNFIAETPEAKKPSRRK